MRKSEIQDGGSQTGNTYISAWIQYSFTIPKVITMFSRSVSSIKLFFIICDASERQISMFVIRHLGFLTNLASHTVEISFSEFSAYENKGIAVGIFAATLYKGWDISIYGLWAAILEFWLLLVSLYIQNSLFELISGHWKHKYRRWNCAATLGTGCDISISGLWVRHFEFLASACIT